PRVAHARTDEGREGGLQLQGGSGLFDRVTGGQRVPARRRQDLPHLLHVRARARHAQRHVQLPRPGAERPRRGAEGRDGLASPSRRVPGVTLMAASMAAMMLPTAAPFFVAYGRSSRRAGPTAIVVAIYAAVWAAIGVAAFLVMSRIMRPSALCPPPGRSCSRRCMA